MSRRGPIGWADAVTAARVLGLSSPEDLDLLVDLVGGPLGLGLAAIEPTEPGDDGAVPADPGEDATTPPLWGGPTRGQPAQAVHLQGRDDQGTTVRELPAEPVDDAALTANPLDPTPAGRPVVPYEPPIPERQMRSALAMLVRRPRQSDEVDVDRVVDELAQTRPLTDVPRLTEPSTAAGVHVVADVGPGMLPYAEDVRQFVAHLEQVVGEPAVAVSWVGEDGPAPVADPSRPVLVVSTLGAVRAAGWGRARALWEAFAITALDDGADVTAVVPHRRAWPQPLSSVLRFVVWDDLVDVGRGRVD